MRIADGRSSFYQWDHDQQLIVPEDCTEVHFDNGTQPKALCCAVNEEGKADVPNILLQTAAQIHAYGWNKEHKCVVRYACFWVEHREKPDDYVYTETEILTWEELDRRITALEKGGGGGGGGTPGADGTTFFPSVSESGVISWTNDGGKKNPEPVDLRAAVIASLPVYNGEVEPV